MTLDAIRTELHKHPFRPFALVMADGSEVIVPQHDYLTFSPSGRSLNVYHSPDGYRIVKHGNGHASRAQRAGETGWPAPPARGGVSWLRHRPQDA